MGNEIFEQIKNRIGVTEVLDYYNSNSKGNYRECPFHSDGKGKHKNLHFEVKDNNEVGYCHHCKEWGDCFEILEAKEGDSKFAFYKALELSGLDTPADSEINLAMQEHSKERKRIEILTTASDFFHNNLLNDKELLKELQEKRGWNEDTIKKFKIGYSGGIEIKEKLLEAGFTFEEIEGGVSFKGYDFFNNRIIFPYFKGKKVVYLIGRATKKTPENQYEPKFKKLRTDYLPNPLFNINSVSTGTKEIFLTEGVGDCISIDQSGYSCISPVTTSFKEVDFPKMLQFVKGKKVYIANDNEQNQAGKEGAIKTAEYLYKNGVYDIHLITIPKEENVEKIDMCDYLKEPDNSIKTLIKKHSTRYGKQILKDYKYFKELRNQPKSKKPKDIVSKIIPPKSLSMFYASPKTGKSLFLLIMAMCVSTGKKFLDKFNTTKTNCLYISYEDTADPIIQERELAVMRFLKLRKHNVTFITRDTPIDIRSDYDWLSEQIKKNNFGLIIIDTLPKATSYKTSSEEDINAIYKSVFAPLIEKHNICISYVLHTPKSNPRTFLGSQAYIGIVDCSYLFLRKPYYRGRNPIKINVESENRRSNIDKFCFELSFGLEETKNGDSHLKSIEIKYEDVKDGEEIKESVPKSEFKKILNLIFSQFDEKSKLSRKEIEEELQREKINIETKKATITRVLEWASNSKKGNMLSKEGTGKNTKYFLSKKGINMKKKKLEDEL